MKRFRCGVVFVFAALVASFGSGSAATLDDVMARLDSLQRDNQAMRKEIAALRQKEQRSAAAQVGDTRNAPSRQLPPATSSAMAADFPVKGHYVEPPQAFSWSGFYLGLHAGYGWGSNDWSRSSFNEFPAVTISPLSPKTNGALGGIQAGANLQLNNWVLGIEADLAFMHADEMVRRPLPDFGGDVSVTARSQIDWFATFTGRWGYAFDRSLFYVKGGVATAAFRNNFSFSQPGASVDLGAKETTRVGWTVGGGWEYAFAPNWSAKVEYNYLDFGTTSQTFSEVGIGLTLSSSLEIEHSLHIVKAGVNYRF
jgi:outer membrane immunogenic protein